MDYSPATASEENTTTLAALIPGIQSGDSAASEEFCKQLMCGVKLMLIRHVDPQDVGDGVQHVVFTVLKAISMGQLREAQAVWGFAAGVARHYRASYIGTTMQSRQRVGGATEAVSDVADESDLRNPEKSILKREQVRIAKHALTRLKSTEREILVRFYVQEEPVEVICEQMRLTQTQFRLLKSRAKATFADIGHRIAAPSLAARSPLTQFGRSLRPLAAAATSWAGRA